MPALRKAVVESVGEKGGDTSVSRFWSATGLIGHRI